ncbi:hypothetical protein [Rhodalgimonas zhirmunskyi]|uniref:Secreted protein n=1 Tax=Rhodalgimonas zhirmunskyi TaxID=2964767 RepID=A0AAJ1UCJ8_9RHOB|nr:hypothetical protein [Rhodoalgimonas zhirmunskyi]MDQ2095428.1 hypothetical protein [Rhodoalgimonas zhirmunskyi]
MRFYFKISLVALVLSLGVTGYSVFAGTNTAPVTDPGWWLSVGEGLVGQAENGWCSCS